MRQHSGFKTAMNWGTIALGAVLLTPLTEPIANPSSAWVSDLWGSPAHARSSGGRAGGGSFRRSSGSSSSSQSPSRSQGNDRPDSSSSDSNRTPDYNRNPDPYDNRPSYGGGPVIVPVPVPAGPGYYPAQPYPNNNSTFEGSTPVPRPSQSPTPEPENPADVWLGLFILACGAIVPVGIMVWLIRRFRKKQSGSEISNDVVTVSRIQVALLAQARYIQQDLTKLSLEVDTGDPEGLLQLLQETALALLRSPENWSHALGSSQTVKTREEAEQIFNQAAIAQRSKFNVETLTNVGGRTSRKAVQLDPDEGPASYIVVTLLVGTTHDRPLFTEIRTEPQLKFVLEQLAALPADSLLVVEVLWSPQEETDSLTYDELLTEYTDMVQI